MHKAVKFLFLLIMCIALTNNSFALQICEKYRHDIRKWSWFYQGDGYPYHYNMGQAQQESNCRANVTSFDGGEGLFQFTGSTKNWTRKQMNEDINFYLPSDAIKASAWYMSKLHKSNWDGSLWLDYQAFNGGWKLLKTEHDRAGITDHDLMFLVCQRRVIVLKYGSTLDFCEVNYTYSEKVYKYGQKYRVTGDGIWNFWGK